VVAVSNSRSLSRPKFDSEELLPGDGNLVTLTGQSLATVTHMVIEWLTFEVPAHEQDEWLDIEEGIWTRFLEVQPGFVRKEVWVEDSSPDLVHAVIWWESLAQWKQITPEQVDEVDQRMGQAWRACTMKVYDVRRQSNQ